MPIFPLLRKKRFNWARKGLASLLVFAMVFGILPGQTWLPIFKATAQAATTAVLALENMLASGNPTQPGGEPSELERLLQEPPPPWEDQQVNPQAPENITLDGVQVFAEMPLLEPETGGGGPYLAVTGTSQEAFSPVGTGPTSVTFSWQDSLSSWINSQSGTPMNPPGGYQTAVYVRDIKTKTIYQIRGTQENNSGTNTFSWTGNDVQGNQVPDGVYEWYLEAGPVSVTYMFPPPPSAPGEPPNPPIYQNVTAPSYAPEYSKIVLDRKAPRVRAIHDLGGGQVGIELEDEVSGLVQLTTTHSPQTQLIENNPLRVVVPVSIGSTEALTITVKDMAGNEAQDVVAAYPDLAHQGYQPFWPKAQEQIAGEQITVNLFSGNAHQAFAGFTQPGIGLDLDISLGYNHQNRTKGPLGYGWTLSLDNKLTLWPQGHITWLAADGTSYWFLNQGTGYQTYVGGQPQYYPQLTLSGDQGYELTWSDMSVQLFTADGRLIQQKDRYDNTINYQYEELEQYHGTAYRLVKVTGTTNKEIDLIYDEETGSLKEITGPGPEIGSTRQISFTYYPDAQLKEYTDVMDNSTTFTYDQLKRLETVTDPRTTITTWSYGQKNRVAKITMTRQQDGVEEFLAVQYGDNTATVSRPSGSYQFGWDIQGRPAYLKQEVTVAGSTATAETRYLYDRNNLIKETDPLGRERKYRYDERDRLQAGRNAAGGIMAYRYNQFNDLVEENGTYGYRMEYQHNLAGKKITSTIAINHISDPFGRTTPSQAVTVNMFNQRGLLTSRFDGNMEVTSYEYDSDGNRTFNGFDERYEYDQNGNLTKMVLHPGTPDAATTTYRYNNRGQAIYVKYPNGLIEEWEYDSLGLLKTFVRYDEAKPTTKRQTTAYEYNQGQHLILEIIDTMETTYQVDGMGNTLTQKIKPKNTGETPLVYEYRYDSRGYLTTTKNPTGQEITRSYNLAGQLEKQTTSPGEYITEYEYDQFGRLASTTTPEGGREEYGTDLMGRQAITKTYRTVNLPQGVPVTLSQSQEVLTAEYRYNSAGQLLEEKTPAGSWTRYTYDNNGNVKTETYGGPIPIWQGTALASGQADSIYPGHEILSTRSAKYDRQGRIREEVDGQGYRTEYRYEGLTTKVLVPAFDENQSLVSYTYSYTYDPMGNLKTKKTPQGHTDSYEYDVFGKITLINNPEGKKIRLVYDQLERLDYTIEDITTGGQTQRVEYTYDPWHYQKTVRRQLEGSRYALTQYQYNSLGQLKQKIDPVGLKTIYEYDAHGNLKKETAHNYIPTRGTELRTTEYDYDQAWNNYKTTWPDGSVSYSLYDTTGNRVLEIDQEGQLTRYAYNPDGLPISFKELGKTQNANAQAKTALELAFDGKGNLTLLKDPLGYLTLYNYDQEGRLTAKKSTGQTLGGRTITQEYRYDPRGLQIAAIDGAGFSTLYQYNADGRLAKEIDPEGIWTRYEYSSAGFVTAIRRPLGRDTETQYNLRGQKVWQKDALGYQYQFNYDAGGRLKWETNKRNDQITYWYDDAGRVEIKYTPNDGTYRYAYDLVGNQIQVTKPVYGTTYYRYDQVNNLVEVNEPGLSGARLITTYTYDKAGNRKTQMDPNNQLTSYQYDHGGRKTDETMYLGGMAYNFQFQYDPAGNLTLETKPGGRWVNNVYNFLHQLEFEQHSDGRRISYTYYDNGKLKTETTPEGTTTYTYYDNGQPKTVTFPNGDLVEYNYDVNGDLEVEIVNGQPRHYDRDVTGRTTTYTDAKGYSYEYKYDPDGFIDIITLPNGVKTKYDYKPGHLIDQKVTTGPAGESIYFNEYQHNQRDYVTVVDENGRTFAYGYENREQLEQVTLPAGDIRLYTYDGAGNRTTRSAIIGGREYDRGEVIELEELLNMILAAIKDDPEKEAKADKEGSGNAKGQEKENQGKGQNQNENKGNSKGNVSYLNGIPFSMIASLLKEEAAYYASLSSPKGYPAGMVGEPFQLVASKGGGGGGGGNSGGNSGGGNSGGNSGGLGQGNQGQGNQDKDKDKNEKQGGQGNQDKDKGNSGGKGIENALERGKGKKLGLLKKLGLVEEGPLNPILEKKTGQVENILAVLDNIVNGEVNLPPGDKEELFALVREVGKGYTVLGTTWTYNERNEIISKENHIRFEEYDFEHDTDGNMTTDGRSIYEWNAKGQLTKVTFPDGFGQEYIYDARGRRTKTSQFNHQGNTQWEVNHHYQGGSWLISHETDEKGDIIMEYTYDERGKPLSVVFQGEPFWYIYNGHGDVVALTDINGEIAARYEYDEWGVVTRMYNRFGERVREGIGWMGDLNTGTGTPGSKTGPQGDDEIDYHPGQAKNTPQGQGKGLEKNQDKRGSGDSSDAGASVNSLTSFEDGSGDTGGFNEGISGFEAGIFAGDEEIVTADITTELVKQNPFRYAGYYWDRKTQNYYLQARYYNPRIGRFLSMDPWRGEITNPLSLNRYVYALNNPVNYVDPTGLMAWRQVGDLVTGLLESALEEIISLLPLNIVQQAALVWDVGKALFSKELSVPDLLKAMTQSFTEPIRYLNNNTLIVVFNDPRYPTDNEVRKYGKNLGDTIILAVSTAAGVTALAKSLPKFTKMIKEVIPSGRPSVYAGDLGVIQTKGTSKAITAPTNRNGLRSAMEKISPKPFADAQAHHGLPWNYREWFAQRGLNVNDPKFGAWVKGGGNGGHQSWSKAYDDVWNKFISDNPNATAQQVGNFYKSIRTNKKWGGGF